MVHFNNNISSAIEAKIANERAIVDEKVKSLQLETEKAKEAAHQAALKAASQPAPAPAPAGPSTVVVPITTPSAAPTSVTNTVSPTQHTPQNSAHPVAATPRPVPANLPGLTQTHEVRRDLGPHPLPSEKIKKKKNAFG